MVCFKHLSEQLKVYQHAENAQRHQLKRSSVVLFLRGRDSDTEVLMIRRAEREGDPWSGHMGFPGGRMDPDDAHSFATACREVEEEMGFDALHHGCYLGRLGDLQATGAGKLQPLVVSPFVMEMRREPVYQPNHEVADFVWIPLSYFRDHGNRESMVYEREGMNLKLPVYYYRQYRVWGMSLRMLDELLGLLDFKAS